LHAVERFQMDKELMSEESQDQDGPPVPPVAPRPEEFGLTESDLKRLTLRDALLAEGLASVIMVLASVLAIWKYWLWGIPIACATLGVLYLLRRIIAVVVNGRIDKARAEYKIADEAHTKARRDHDEAMDAWEAKQITQE
jgi:hypothetical protein